MNRTALVLCLVVLWAGVVLGCQDSRLEYRYLELSLLDETTPPNRIVARARVGDDITRFDQDIQGVDLLKSTYVIQLLLPNGSPFNGPTEVSLVAYHDDIAVASWAGLVELSTNGVTKAGLTRLPEECDADGDGFANCLAADTCCTQDLADYAHDCDDTTGLITPYAETDSCRTCADDDDDGVYDCLAVGPIEDLVDASDEDVATCEPDCAPGRCDLDDGCGGSCECGGGAVCNGTWCVVKGMTHVPGDDFYMGCNSTTDPSCDPAELPQRVVAVAAFDIDTTEVSNQDYQACVADGACTPQSLDDGQCFVIDPSDANWNAMVVPAPDVLSLRQPLHPAVCLDWNQARTYCESFRCPDCRLCTEAEFEMASRGSCQLYEGKDCQDAMPTYPWGEESPLVLDGQGEDPGNFADETAGAKYAFLEATISGYVDGYAETAPVGSFPDGESKYGVRDLSGNVWEWVQDCWHDSFDGAPTDGSAWEEEGCQKRVRRGGSWVSGTADVRSGARSSYDDTFRVDLVGFRCCRSAE